MDVKTLIPRGSWLIDQIQEQAFEEAGEAAEGWLDHATKEAMDDLRGRVAEAVAAWLEADPARHIHFWGVEKVQKHTVTPEQVSQN
jgi:hypothetical protein